MNSYKYIFLSLLILAFGACKKGFEGTAQIPKMPETFMAIDKIERSGDNRLTTLVEAHWWGVSEGGFIKGFEISIDNQQTWHFTTRQDSSFLLKIPPGQDTADIAIYVRAIDNANQTDGSPASTLFPIKNSKPAVRFIFSSPIAGIPSQNPINIFPVLKYNIFGEDPDGIDDIFEYEIYFNDTQRAPYLLPANTSSILLVANNPRADSSDCKIFINESNRESVKL